MQEIYLNGTLSLDEQDQTRMNYIITSLENGKQTSITDIFDTIYNGKNTINKLVRVSGRIYNNHTLPFNGFQTLHISKDKYGTYSYHIGNFAIENQLYELLEKNIEIVIEDYTDATKDMFAELVDNDDTTGSTMEDINNDAEKIS